MEEFVLLGRFTANDSPTLDITGVFQSGYRRYQLVLQNMVPAVNWDDLRWRVSTDGGANWDAGNNYSEAALFWEISAQEFHNNAADSFSLAAGDLSNTESDGGACAVINVFNPLSAASYKHMHSFSSSWDETGGNLQGRRYFHVYKSTSAMNAIRFYMSSGNITSGTIRVYGYGTSTSDSGLLVGYSALVGADILVSQSPLVG